MTLLGGGGRKKRSKIPPLCREVLRYSVAAGRRPLVTRPAEAALVYMLGEYLLLLLEHIIQIHVVSEVGLDSHQMVCVDE